MHTAPADCQVSNCLCHVPLTPFVHPVHSADITHIAIKYVTKPAANTAVIGAYLKAKQNNVVTVDAESKS